MHARRCQILLLLLTAATSALGCTGSEQPTEATATAGRQLAVPRGAASNAPPKPTTAPPAEPHRYALPLARWRRLLRALSEPSGEFISDNYLSNETSYLQVAAALAHRTGAPAAYIGVGPEQNFSYLALLDPARAYIVDLRRDNLLLHLYYKALFDLAPSRADFVAMLTGRLPMGEAATAAAEAADERDANLTAVLAIAEAQPATEQSFASVHARLLRRIEHGYGVALDGHDRHSLMRIGRALFERGLGLRFELRDGSTRRYPTLRELLVTRDPSDRYGSFLATTHAYRVVRRLQQQNRVIPLIGNFAGDRAMKKLAAHLQSEQLVVASFYVSNVEQYLMRDGLWWKWRRNVATLPIDGRSVFIRAYLDQGERHPRQLPGHRTTTTLQRIADFQRHRRPYRSMLALCTDALLAPG